jgi:hypothetical protein
MHFFAVTAADSEIVAAAAKYWPQRPKKLQDQWFKCRPPPANGCIGTAKRTAAAAKASGETYTPTATG